MYQDHFTRTLQFWRAVETFNLPDIPTRRRNDHKLFTEWKPGVRMPWDEGELFAGEEGKEWRHTLYFHVVAKDAVVNLLARLTGSAAFHDPVPGRTSLAALVVDRWGRPSDGGYFPAAFIYAIKLLQEGRHPEELAELLGKAQEDYLNRFQLVRQRREGEETLPNVLDEISMEKELEYLQGLTRHDLRMQHPVLCVSELVNAGAGIEAPFLNSYYLNDLDMLINVTGGGLGKPLETYLSETVNREARDNLLRPAALLESIHPGRQPAGRWPSNPSFGLYTAQQAALNLTMAGLRDGGGLMGVNGPPGTGKTTLLREVIADVVVERAKRLLQTDVGTLFEGKRRSIVDMAGYYDINRAVFGNDGVVVASNNNTAVENISRELPAIESIDLATFKDAEYFSGVARDVHGKPCWGLLSAVLGRSDNRSDFINKFWFNKGRGFGRHLKELFNDPAQAKINRQRYEETAEELRSVLKEYDVFRELVCEYHGLLQDGRGGQQVLADRLMKVYEIAPGNMPDAGFINMSLKDIHRMMPYSSEKVNRLRSNIFLLSLELHEWAIRVNARQFNSNLNSFIDLLSGKHSGFINEEIAAVLWNSFFFCIPVVSVTLASFQRQFQKLGKGGIGWLLLDEAGQATPASACGAIWRSERSIVIGDTLQIPPVVTIPHTLGKLLQDHYGVADDSWSPVYRSAQFLADRVTVAGTYVEQGDGERVWTGIPLRAHRRCDEPMFSLSNNMAYEGQMVKVAQDRVSEAATGASGWLDVPNGSPGEGHVILEELAVLRDMLMQLSNYEGRIYVISPFRSVADVCAEVFYVPGKVECGTIHTFQGKEAEIVFLVLGTHTGSVAARDWASQRPNMLNVAVTRAKERLYVIGSRETWGRHRYFDQLADRLPVKEHARDRLF